MSQDPNKVAYRQKLRAAQKWILLDTEALGPVYGFTESQTKTIEGSLSGISTMLRQCAIATFPSEFSRQCSNVLHNEFWRLVIYSFAMCRDIGPMQGTAILNSRAAELNEKLMEYSGIKDVDWVVSNLDSNVCEEFFWDVFNVVRCLAKS